MSFFDKKEEVLDIVLTPHGRYLISQGEFMPQYYSFIDDDILYDVTAADGSESNYQTKARILDETPYLKPQSCFVDLEKKITDMDKDLTSDTIKYNVYTLGTSNNTEKHVPAWELTMIRNQISSSTTKLTASYGDQNIPQINVDIEYQLSIANINDAPNPRGLAPSPELQVGRVFNDGTFLKVEPDQALFHILEKNGFLHNESLEIEAFKYDVGSDSKLIPLTFLKRPETIVNDILLDEDQVMVSERSGETDGVFDPSTVDYFFELRIDKEIPIKDICEGISNLKSNDIFADFGIECPDQLEGRTVSIYSSPVSPEDIEDCKND